MSLRNIRIIGDDILRKRSKEVTEINGRILELLDDMVETMRASNGVGLAAPQVGVLRRVVVVDTGEGLHELINPVITAKEGEEIQKEGCLSVPEHVGDVKRPYKVTVSALNRSGKKIRLAAEGYLARAVCHEIDHLDGVLFVDIADKLIRKDEMEE
jgi:peptide deformylase